jgi:hypothetical protein
MLDGCAKGDISPLDPAVRGCKWPPVGGDSGTSRIPVKADAFSNLRLTVGGAGVCIVWELRVRFSGLNELGATGRL